MVMPRSGASNRAPRLIPKVRPRVGLQVIPEVAQPSQPTPRILYGDCVAELAKLPAGSVDLVFADPPYNLQLQGDLKRPDDSRVDAVNDDWDKFSNFAAYDDFTRAWLTSCRRGLEPNATLWVIRAYHYILPVRATFEDLGFWTLHHVVLR